VRAGLAEQVTRSAVQFQGPPQFGPGLVEAAQPGVRATHLAVTARLRGRFADPVGGSRGSAGGAGAQVHGAEHPQLHPDPLLKSLGARSRHRALSID
jgi:hypothetical protein